MEKNLTIRNSTAEFLIFQVQDKSQGIEVLYHDETFWATQKAMSILFDCTTDNIGVHLKNIFASGELQKESVTEKNSVTASDGKNYLTQFYNLDAILSVGYRINSVRATQFRQWCTNVLPMALLRYPTPKPPPSGRWLSRPSASKRDVTPAPHFLTSLAILAYFWMKTASDVTLEPISVTSLNKNGITCYSKIEASPSSTQGRR